jgi:hypothetical protein
LTGTNAPQVPPGTFERGGAVRNETIATPVLASNTGYTLRLSVSPASAFGDDTRIVVSLSQASTTLVAKTLHAGDAQVLAMFHPAVSGPAKLKLAVESPLAKPARFQLEVVRNGKSPRRPRPLPADEDTPTRIALAR